MPPPIILKLFKLTQLAIKSSIASIPSFFPKKFESLIFNLPEERIAKHPAFPRDACRLMVLERQIQSIKSEFKFYEVGEFLQSGDILVTNTTKVSRRSCTLLDSSGTEIDFLFVKCHQGELKYWECLTKKAKKLRPNDLFIDQLRQIQFTMVGRNEKFVILRSEIDITDSIFKNIGNMPLPPYMHRRAVASDLTDYQTVYAEDSEAESIAAPTAGLHFSIELIDAMKRKGIQFCSVELKINEGTFSPLTEENFKGDRLHEEKYYVSESSAKLLNSRKSENKIIAVGTTSLRVLETIFDKGTGTYNHGQGVTDIFLYPGKKIESTDGLLTNFHLPGSSLLLLTAAFGGIDLVVQGYQTALAKNYRFYSYGDAMLIL